MQPRNVFNLLACSGLLVIGASCSSTSTTGRQICVSVADQKVALLKDGKVERVYGCSTSKFGVGDTRGSYATPLGNLVVANKIGKGAPVGMAFKGRQATGEIVPPNAPGRDIITTRIMQLSGRESKNAKAYARCIYIHGTPEESRIGSPASYGCIRMRNLDIVDLFDKVAPGTPVSVTTSGLPLSAKFKGEYAATPRTATRPAAAPAPVQAPQSMVAAQNTPPPAVRLGRLGPEVPRSGEANKNHQKTVR